MGVFYLPADEVFLAIDAVRVDLVQNTGAVAGSGGHLGVRAGRVQPQGQGGVPQIRAAAGERGGGQFLAGRGLAGGVPGTAVDGLAEHAAADAAEQPSVTAGPAM